MKPERRNKQVVRQWELLQELQARRMGMSLEQAAQLLGVTTRTIRRDLEALEEARFPIVKDVATTADPTSQKRNVWRLMDLRRAA